MQRALAVPVTALAATAAGLAYAGGYEVRSFRLRRVTVPVLAPGARRCGCCTSPTCT